MEGLNKDQFSLAYVKWCLAGGHSFDEWDVETAWIAYSNGTSDYIFLYSFVPRDYTDDVDVIDLSDETDEDFYAPLGITGADDLLRVWDWKGFTITVLLAVLLVVGAMRDANNRVNEKSISECHDIVESIIGYDNINYED